MIFKRATRFSKAKSRTAVRQDFDLKQVPKRVPLVEVAPENAQQIARGLRDRLTANLNYNLSKIMQRVPGEQLGLELLQVGSVAPKQVAVVYLQNTADSQLVREVTSRIKAIKAETILDSSYIERNIEDANFSPFPQVETTQRVDIIESALFQGRVAILTDGSPDILLAPATFFDLMDTPEDAYSRWYIAASFFRLARYIMFILAVSLPGFYIALTSFNPELLPTSLALMIAGDREGTPFPIYFEAFMMMGVVEAVRMMMIRLPSQIGAAIALFAGISLIFAGIVSNLVSVPVTIVVTLTIIASFGIPNYDLRKAVRIIQFFTMIMTTILGLFGFAAAFIYLAIHLVALKSFGIPFMSPLAPLEASGWKHTIVRGTTERMVQDETYKPGK